MHTHLDLGLGSLSGGCGSLQSLLKPGLFLRSLLQGLCMHARSPVHGFLVASGDSPQSFLVLLLHIMQRLHVLVLHFLL